MKHLIITVSMAFGIAGCGTANNYLAEKQKTIEYYRIFDIKTPANRQVVAQAASDGIGRNVNNAQEATPIPSSADLPEKAGRFKLVNPFEGSALGNFAALAGGAGRIGPRVATCDGAVWTAKAQREISGSNNLNLSACLFQYKDGYHLDLYAVFTKQEGGLFQISRDMANALVGTPEEWTEKTFLDIVRSIHTKVGADIVLLEAQPPLSGTPWLDSMGTK
jgi:outer membrane lipoprotein SlyB